MGVEIAREGGREAIGRGGGRKGERTRGEREE